MLCLIRCTTHATLQSATSLAPAQTLMLPSKSSSNGALSLDVH